MINQPFAVFGPYSDRVRVRLYDRSDAVQGDETLETLEQRSIVGGEHVHGNVTVVVRDTETERIAGADGLATDAQNLTLHTRGADCQIFAVYDPVKHVGGVLHAGWRGLVANAIPSFIDTMKREWGTNPADLIVGAGPSLCFFCAEFTDPTTELTGIDPRWFKGRLADLPSIADEQWMTAGVTRGNIERHPDCTKCDKHAWWSLRAGDKESLSHGYRNALTFSLI